MPPQTAVQARARRVRIEKLPDHGKQIVERDQQRLSQGHRDGFLRWRQCRLQPMRGMATILNAVPLAPFINGLRVCWGNDSLDRFLILRTPEALCKCRSSIIAGLDCGSNLWRRRGLLMKMNQHGGTQSRSSLRTDLAMNRADRRGEM